MAFDFTLTQNMVDGTTVIFRDTSIGVDYTLVKAVRFQMSNYIDELNETTVENPAEMEQYRLYRKTSITPSVYDNKTLVLSSYYYPFITGLTVLSGDTFEKAARYSRYYPPSEYLPTASQSPLEQSLSDWGLPDFTVFPDRVYSMQYEVYKDTSPTTLANVTDEQQYIVHGNAGSTAVWNGNTYRPGEVFIATDNGAVSFTGGAVLKELWHSKNKYYTFTWNIQSRLNAVVIQALEDCRCDDELLLEVDKIWAELSALQWMDYTEKVSISVATSTVSRLEQKLSILENCENA